MGQARTAVLILDHDPVRRDHASRIAENGGYRATEVAHAGEAFDALGVDPKIRAVIGANRLPAGIDGIALAGTIRCYWPDVGIVLLAERVLPSDADLPSDTIVLMAPFRPNDLVEAIAEAVRARAATKITVSQPDQRVESPQMAL